MLKQPDRCRSALSSRSDVCLCWIIVDYSTSIKIECMWQLVKISFIKHGFVIKCELTPKKLKLPVNSLSIPNSNILTNK